MAESSSFEPEITARLAEIGVPNPVTGPVEWRKLSEMPEIQEAARMRKVYLATAGEYSDFRVCHAFASREDAESYKLGDEVMELEVHAGPVEVRTWYSLKWRGDRGDFMGTEPRGARNPHVYAGEQRDFDGNEKHVEHRWDRGYMQETEGNAHLTVEGWDLALVKKVYGEQRTQYLARQEGIS